MQISNSFTNFNTIHKPNVRIKTAQHVACNNQYADAPVTALKAYCLTKPSLAPSFKGLEQARKIISEEAAAKFLEEAGVKRPALIPEIINTLKDAEGKIQESVLNLFGIQNKSCGPLAAKSIFSSCKENGEINENVAEYFVNMFKRTGFSYGMDYNKIINSCKNPDGTFSSEILKLLQNEKIQITSRADVIDRLTNQYRNKDKTFNVELIKAVDNAVTKGEKYSDAIMDRLYALNADGTINEENMNIYRELKNMHIDYNLNTAYQTICRKEGEEKQAAIEFIREHKNERDLGKIIRIIDEDGQKFNDDSMNYAKDLIFATRDDEQIRTRYKNLLNIKKENFNEETKKLIQRFLWSGFTPEFETSIVNYATKENKIDSEKINKLIDIYDAAKYKEGDEKACEYVTNLMNGLPKGQYEETFDVFHTLFTKKFGEKGLTTSPFYLDFLLGAATHKNDSEVIKNLTERAKFALSTKIGQLDPSVAESMTFFCVPERIKKLEEIDFLELNIEPKQILSLQRFEEETLLKLKKFIKEYQVQNNIKTCDITYNPNVKGQMIISHSYGREETIFDAKTFEKLAVSETQGGRYNNVKRQKDLRTNTTTEIIENRKSYFETTIASQKRVVRNKNGEIAYTEVLKKSEIPGVFNIEHNYPDGTVNVLSKAYIDPKTGNEIIHKELESLNGTNSYYHHERDKAGNRFVDYTIHNKDGKEAAKVNSTFEVLSENHFITSKNGEKYDILFNNNIVTVKNLTDGEELTYDLAQFSDGTQDKLMPLFKQIPGDEWFKMKKIGVSKMIYRENFHNAGWLQKNTCKDNRPDSLPDKSMVFGDDYIDYSIYEHELGHAIDENLYAEIGEEIAKDPKLLEIWNKERELFRAEFSDAQQEFISYFIADAHYLGLNGGLKEGIAETNTLLNNTHIRNDKQSVRLQYWQQYFPETIAYLSKIL